MPKPACPLEHQEQADFVMWLNLKRIPFFAVPNENKRTKRYGARLKRQGMQAGVPDIIIIQRSPIGDRSVAVEMKRIAGSTTSPEQLKMHTVMRRCGWHVLVARGFRDAVERVKELGWH